LRELGDLIDRCRLRTEIPLLQVRELERVLGRLLGARGAVALMQRAQFEQQATDRCVAGPTRQAIVAVIDDAARLQLLVDETGHRLARPLADPGPDAVQGDEIELRQIGIEQLLEGTLDEGDVGEAELCRAMLRAVDMRRIEIDAVESALREAAGERYRALAEAATEIDMREAFAERSRPSS